MLRSALAKSQSLIVKSTMLVGAVVAVAITPAHANSAAAASDSFRVNPEDLKNNKTALGVSDPEFRNIFGNWGQAAQASNKIGVAVPSINPVEAMKLSSNFGRRRAPKRGASRNHKGIDIPGPVGTPILATADAIVGRAQRVSGYGKFIELDHGNAIQTRYGHMSALNVYAGQRVKKGDVIGFMGSTGNSTGSHLHYEVRIAGEAINPAGFLSQKQAVETVAPVAIAAGPVVSGPVTFVPAKPTAQTSTQATSSNQLIAAKQLDTIATSNPSK
jgi:murein DD-endopeptidase MepM/ murein hydrolase activator NlpD